MSIRALLIAHKNPYPPNDGGNMGIYTMINGLLLHKVNLDVLLMNPIKMYKKLDSSLVPSGITHIKDVKINTNVRPLNALKNLLFEKDSYFTSRFYDAQFEKILIEFLKNNQYDIVQLESIFSAVYLPVIKKYSQARVVLSAHNIEHQIWQRMMLHEKNLFKKLYLNIQIKRLKHFEDNLFKQVDAVTAVTELDKKYILSICPYLPVVVTPNGMDIQTYQLAPFEQQQLHTIFYLGSLDWLPNQQGILWFLDHVWQKVLAKNPSIQLIIAGKNIPEWLINRQEKNVKYYSNVPNTKELYDKYAITIVPLLAGSGIRVRIIEGMAYGKCIISTSIGAEGVPYTHQKNIIIADTADDFANQIITLTQNPQQVKQIQQEARLLAEQYYDKEKVYLPLIELYHQLIRPSNIS